MQEYYIFDSQARKNSMLTDVFQNDQQCNNQENEAIQIQLPQLKNFMSHCSDVNGESISRVLSNQFLAGPQFDFENINNKNKQENLIQTVEQQLTIRNELDKPIEQIREKRNRKVISYNNDSDDQSQSNKMEKSQVCKCNKSHCLQLYCPCFHKNQQCSTKCSCYDCHNTQEHLTYRNKALDKIKVKQQRQTYDEDLFDRSKVWGCKCTKSNCKKNYCECFIRNQKCSSHCKCKDCQNKKRPQNCILKKQVKIEE